MAANLNNTKEKNEIAYPTFSMQRNDPGVIIYTNSHQTLGD